jgi:hypothetical protein
MLMESIIDHRKDENAVPKDDENVVVNGKQSQKITSNSASNGRMGHLARSPSKR